MEVDSFGIPLLEIANAIQTYTGLAGVVYFCTKDEMKNPQSHSLGRVKLRRSGESVSCSIKTKPDGSRIIRGTNQQMIKDIVRFVEANQDLLWTYWLTPKDEADSAETMRNFKKV